jgi:hypothetical protein
VSGAPVTPRSGVQQGELNTRNVTALSAAERKRRQRERERSAALLYARDDWELFLDIGTLPQKAGAQPRDLPTLVLKELTDNALDTGASNVTLSKALRGAVLGYVISDDGPGIEPSIVPKLFTVNRPLLTSKLRRLPLRGMLGNGLRVVAGAVAASQGALVVETRGHRLTLQIDDTTGLTTVADDEPVAPIPGTVVHVALASGLRFRGDEHLIMLRAISIARSGKIYSGASSPHWFSVKDLHRLFQCVERATTTVGEVVADLGFSLFDDRRARDLSRDEVAEVLTQLQREIPPVSAEALGYIGPNAFASSYAIKAGMASLSGANIPFVIEAWAVCNHGEGRGENKAEIALWLNRSPSFAEIAGAIYGGALFLKGCGIHQRIGGVGAGSYSITISIIIPFVELAGDGKTPALSPFRGTIAEVVGKAAKAAHRAMVRPPASMSIKDAAWAVMEQAYAQASDDGRLPANARQIMYAARPKILAATGAEKLGDAYFTQALLPDYIVKNPGRCGDWDVVFDARGHFVEPHTGRSIPLGTLAVRQYLGDRSRPEAAVTLNSQVLYPTSGPENRYRNVLYIEKEGFDALIAQAQIADRYDLAVMSTKGMSVVAARHLLDRLAPLIDRVFVLHDFDISGFTIGGTLTADGRRYIFENAVHMVDLGLRLDDVNMVGLQSEPVSAIGNRDARVETLRRHGATWEEVEFLTGVGDDVVARRVELNAMTSRQFIDFIETKLIEHGVEKVVPGIDTIEAHARRLIEQRLAHEALSGFRDRIAKHAAEATLPVGIEDQLRNYLARHPNLPWDVALGEILVDQNGRDVMA